MVVAVAVVGPFVAPHAPTALVGQSRSRRRPGDFPLGTDYLGHDVLAPLLWGGRSVLWMALATPRSASRSARSSGSSPRTRAAASTTC